MAKFAIGAPKGNRTPVSALRGQGASAGTYHGRTIKSAAIYKTPTQILLLRAKNLRSLAENQRKAISETRHCAFGGSPARIRFA